MSSMNWCVDQVDDDDDDHFVFCCAHVRISYVLNSYLLTYLLKLLLTYLLTDDDDDDDDFGMFKKLLVEISPQIYNFSCRQRKIN